MPIEYTDDACTRDDEALIERANSTPKHTPGPWTMTGEDSGDEYEILRAGDTPAYERTVATVRCCIESKANARLIARAPEMAAEIAQLQADKDELLEALTWALECMREAGLGAQASCNGWDADSYRIGESDARALLEKHGK